jgi:hypothetical protein
LIEGCARADVYLFDDQISIRNEYKSKLANAQPAVGAASEAASEAARQAARIAAREAAIQLAFALPFRPTPLRVAEALHNVV